ncbi:MAG: winged helix-turn-helix domain-containing protein [Chloroflexi bacterium]|nr:winged helix-turn-helix domain-containing protein [Chloroflexota bacterium]
MEALQSNSNGLHLVRRTPAPSPARGCEVMLSVLTEKVQLLLDHVQVLEDRIQLVESGAGAAESFDSPALIDAGAVQIDHAARRVYVSGNEIPLSPTEYRLIYHLAANSGKVVLHRDLLRRASVHGDVNPANLKVYIGRLRAKLKQGNDSLCEVEAVRGVGYRLTA